MKPCWTVCKNILQSTHAMKILLLFVLLSLLGALAQVLSAECISWIANQISVGAFAIERWQILGLTGFYLTMVAAAYAEKRASNRLTRTVQMRLRERVDSGLLSAGHAWLTDHGEGEVLTKYTKNLQGGVSLACSTLPALFRDLAVAAFSLLYMCTALPAVAALYFVLLAAAIWAQGKVGGALMDKARVANADYTALMDSVERSMRASRLIRANRLEGFFENQALRLRNQYLKSVMQVFAVQARSITAASALGMLPLCALCIASAIMAALGQISVGEFLAIYLIAGRAQGAVNAIPHHVMNLKSQSVDADALLTMLEEMRASGQQDDRRTADVTDGISVQNVDFSYGERPILCNVSFEVRRGESLAIIGQSGCGKSTLLHLLAGRLSPARGRISRPETAYLSQNLRIYPGSVQENISLVPGAADVEKSLRTFAADGFLREFAAGLNTEMRPDGAPFSQGQRQRLLLALAAMAENNAFMLLDEPVSGLDASLRRRVMDAILARFSPGGVIVVTHDWQCLAGFDRVLWLEAGRVRYLGPPERMPPELKDLSQSLEQGKAEEGQHNA